MGGVAGRPAAAAAPAGMGGPAVRYRDVESDREVAVESVQIVGNETLYRRGNQWFAASAKDVDLKRDADKVKTVERFSDEYFKLVAANTPAENTVLARQQAGEELIVKPEQARRVIGVIGAVQRSAQLGVILLARGRLEEAEPLRSELEQLFSAVFSLVAVALTVIVLVLELFAPQVTWLVAGGFDDPQRLATQSLLRVMLPSYQSACRCASASPSANVVWCRSSSRLNSSGTIDAAV